MSAMATDELWPTLLRFHRELLEPRFAALEERADRNEAWQRDADGHFDAMYRRFDRLETEYHMLVVGLKRVEDRLDGVEGRLDAIEGRLGGIEAELVALRAERTEIVRRMAEVEGQIRAMGPRRR